MFHAAAASPVEKEAMQAKHLVDPFTTVLEDLAGVKKSTSPFNNQIEFDRMLQQSVLMQKMDDDLGQLASSISDMRSTTRELQHALNVRDPV